MARAMTGFAQQAAERSIGMQWAWYVALGVGLFALAVVAFYDLSAATVATVYLVGIMMLIGAIAQIAAAFQSRHWGGFVLWLLSGLLYGVAGIFAFANPELAAVALTVVLAVSLIASGVLRIWWSMSLRAMPGWGWMAASGAITLIAGIVFIIGWPQNALWLLGMLLAFDLAFQGATAAGFGLALRQRAK
jgi:uncharacterized membrane protein HdeD (DUF308 family)